MNTTTLVQHPSGFPYILFVQEKERSNFILAVNDLMAKRETPNGVPVYSISVFELISNVGHQQTTNFLRKFGDNWVCKEGKIFFKRNNVNGGKHCTKL